MPAAPEPWSAIASHALLGTDNHPFTPASTADWPGPLSAAAAHLAGPSQTMLLQAVCLATTYQNGGLLPRSVDAPPRGPAPSGHNPPDGAVRHLRDLLAEQTWDLVSEWFDLARTAGYRLPTVLLPELLTLAARPTRDAAPTSITAYVVASLDEHGQWLAAQHPAWRKLSRADEVVDDVWAHGTASQRARWLAEQRVIDPDRARALLEAGWSRENASNRAALLDVLACNLGDADEEFLERALDDRRPEVRRAAKHLLCLIPSSQYVRAFSAVLRAHVSVTSRWGKVTIRVARPIQTESIPARYFTDDRDPGPGRDGSTSADRRLIATLTTCGAVVPRSVWLEMGLPERCTKFTVLDDLPDQRLAAALAGSWVTSARRRADVGWCRALAQDSLPYLDSSTRPLLIASLPAAERVAAALAALTTRSRGSREDTQMLSVLASIERPWPHAVTALLLEQGRLRPTPSPESGLPGGSWDRWQRGAVSALVRRGHVTDLPAITAYLTGLDHRLAAPYLAVLDARRALHDAFHPPPPAGTPAVPTTRS